MSLDGIRLRQTVKLTDVCTVTRGTFPDHTPVETGLACHVRPSRNAHREVEVAGGDKVAVPAYRVRVPASANVARGDVVAVTSARDPAFTGKYLTVISVTGDTWVATRVVLCVEQQT